MALGYGGDIVTFVSPARGGTHYGVALGNDGTNTIVAWKLGVSARDHVEWDMEESTSSVTVLSSTDALHR
jgi:hypothetical protein